MLDSVTFNFFFGRVEGFFIQKIVLFHLWYDLFTMIDIHPISVHFPIALLTVYTIVQLIPPRITWRVSQIFFLNCFLLLTGSFGILVARQLGDELEGTHREVAQLVQTHSQWATMSTALYGTLTVIYVFLILKKVEQNPQTPSIVRTIANVSQPISSLAKFLFDYYIVTFIAILGLIFITITGALGGAIVYGPDADPMVSFVTSWLVR